MDIRLSKLRGSTGWPIKTVKPHQPRQNPILLLKAKAKAKANANLMPQLAPTINSTRSLECHLTI